MSSQPPTPQLQPGPSTTRRWPRQSTSLLLLATLLTLVSAEPQIYTALVNLKVTPNILQLPSDIGLIKWESNGRQVNPGDPVPARLIKDVNLNKVSWEADPGRRYTLLLVDLDRKLSVNASSTAYNQFTSFNIPGNSINGGQTIVAFDPPFIPCLPSQKHRILMLALEQQQIIDISEVGHMSASSGPSPRRENFKLAEFIKRHSLSPVAASVFSAVGEAGGQCSGAHKTATLASLLIAMVTALSGAALLQPKRVAL